MVAMKIKLGPEQAFLPTRVETARGRIGGRSALERAILSRDMGRLLRVLAVDKNF